MEATTFVRRHTGEKFDESRIKKTVKHLPSVMIWEAITINGPGPLYFFEKTIRKDQYKKKYFNEIGFEIS